MRWKVKQEIGLGTTRDKTRFLLFPKWIRDEGRWMEVCKVRETYSEVNRRCIHTGMNYTSHSWVATEWIDDVSLR